MDTNANPLMKFLKGAWGFIDSARKVTINVLFLLIAILFLVMIFSNKEPKIAKVTALVVNPQGRLVEQLTALSLIHI